MGIPSLSHLLKKEDWFTLGGKCSPLISVCRLGSSGGLGLGEVNISLTPLQIRSDKQGRPFMNIADIACGAHHCLAVDESK